MWQTQPALECASSALATTHRRQLPDDHAVRTCVSKRVRTDPLPSYSRVHNPPPALRVREHLGAWLPWVAGVPSTPRCGPRVRVSQSTVPSPHHSRRYDSPVQTIAPKLLTQGRSCFADSVSTGRPSRTLVVTALGSKRVLIGVRPASCVNSHGGVSSVRRVRSTLRTLRPRGPCAAVVTRK